MGPQCDRRHHRRARARRAGRREQGVSVGQHRTPRARLMTAATTVVAGLLLSSCGGASPGVAAKVGDDELTVRQVDTAAGEMCTALGDQFASQNTVLPMSFVRQGTLQLMILRA